MPSASPAERGGSRLAAALGAALAMVGPACADDARAPGWRSRLQAAGLKLEGGYTAEVAGNRSGGLRRGEVALGEFDLRLLADGQRLFGVEGLSAYVHALRTDGGDPATLSGDAQGVSNIAAPPRWRLFEVWVQRNFAARRMSLLVGRLDLNAEFYRLNAAGLFLNSSFGIGPEFAQTGQGGPSLFPESAFGVRLEGRSGPLVLRTALLDGVPAAVPRADGSTGLHRPGDGALVVAEAALAWPFDRPADGMPRHRRGLGRAAAAAEVDTKLAVGGWHYSARFDDPARMVPDDRPLQQRGASGAYLIGEHSVWRDAAQPGRLARVFVQLGSGDRRVARFSGYTGGGVSLTAPFAGRPDDEAGLALASARNSPGYAEQQRTAGQPADAAETAVELSYLAALRPWLSAQLSLQHVRHPGTDPALQPAKVVQLRVEATF